MGYHVIDPDDLDPEPDRPSEMRYVSEAADMDRMGLRTYTVQPSQFFVAEPESPHRAHVREDADESVQAIGIGAPPLSDGHAFEGE